MAERKAELLQVPYFHIVFTLPAEIGAIAYQNKTVIYDLLFNASPDTMLTIAALYRVRHRAAYADCRAMPRGSESLGCCRSVATRLANIAPIHSA